MPAYALIIGVDAYRTYDPSGDTDLHGAVNDAAAWLKTAQSLGIPAEHTRVLTSRAIPGQTGLATKAEIIEGLEWICEALSQPRHAKALICFCGHGAWDPELGSLLCPSDVSRKGDRIGGAIPAKAMYALLDQRPQLDRHRNAVTLFIDACDAGGGGEKKATGRGLPSPAGNRTGTPTFFNTLNTDLLLAASAPGAESFEVPTTDGVRGAFSFAANAVLARWGTVDDTDGKAFNLTYGDLAERINYITGALDVDQRAHFDSVAIQQSRRVFSEERDTLRGQPPVPHPLSGREISPGANEYEINQYSVTDPYGKIVAYIYAVGPTPPLDWGTQSNCLYWEKTTDPNAKDSLYKQAGHLQTGQTLTIDFVTSKTGSASINPFSPSKADDCTSAHTIGDYQTTLIDLGTSTKRVFSFGLTGYLDARPYNLRWYTPGNLVSPDAQQLVLTLEDDSGAFTGPGPDYLRAVDHDYDPTT